jgi:hypothetical protein
MQDKRPDIKDITQLLLQQMDNLIKAMENMQLLMKHLQSTLATCTMEVFIEYFSNWYTIWLAIYDEHNYLETGLCSRSYHSIHYTDSKSMKSYSCQSYDNIMIQTKMSK